MRVVTDAEINAVIVKMREHFGRETVTRQEMLAYAKDNYVPTRLWSETRGARGTHNLVEIDPSKKVEETKQNTVPMVASYNSQLTPNLTKFDLPVPIARPVATEIRGSVNHNSAEQSIISHFDRDSLIPIVNPDFVEWGNYKDLRSMLASNQFFTLYITGESGSGKNEMVSNACAVLRRPVVRIVLTRDTKEEHLIGSKTLVDGSIKYEEGPVVWAAENGAVLLLDEISAGDANELMCLQNVLEGGAFFVKSLNKMITPKKGFCVIATDNTKGRGNDTGRYMGTNILNDAFLERFQMTMEQGYPTAKIEREIYRRAMQRNGKVDDAFIDQLVKWVHVIRKTYADEAIEEQITTRRGCHIVNVYCMFTSAQRAIELCTSRFDATTKEAFTILWDKITAGEAVSGAPDLSEA